MPPGPAISFDGHGPLVVVKHRADLDGIAAMARPLLPARIQLSRIGPPHPQVRLLLPAPHLPHPSSPLCRAA